MGFIYKYPVQHTRLENTALRTGSLFLVCAWERKGWDKTRTMPITADNSKKNYGKSILS